MRCQTCGTELTVSGCPRCNSDRTRTVGAPGPSAHPSRSAAAVLSDSSEEGRFIPGSILAERYRIISMLGAGGMGEVYRATDLKLGQPVALKFLPESASADALARFRAEVRIARQISHPNVCRVYDIGEVDGQTFLSMEYIAGEDLASLLRRIGRLPHDKAVDVARQVCAGLAAAHDRGVLHRDLKPSNVLLDSRGIAHIADFGLSAAEEIRAGTPLYMAPEQFEGREVTVRSDVYALGLVLYELFTGRRAHDAGSRAELEAQHRSSPVTPSSLVRDLDPAVERVILQCLSVDPELRPPSALAVAAALPGGDPLAAALAAGETPSPALVAAAGEATGIQPRTAAAVFAIALVMIAAHWSLRAQFTSANEAALEKPPDALAVRSREILRSFGYPKPADFAYGFHTHSQYLDHRRNTGQKVKFAPVAFWYRESPETLVNANPTEPGVVVGAVTSQSPRPDRVGMIEMSIDPQGRLITLHVSTPEKASAVAKQSMDWNRMLTLAGLDASHYRPATPEWLPDTMCDERMAWVANDPDRASVEFRVEAAALGGKPVWLRTIMPWTRAARTDPQPRTPGQRAAQAFSVSLLIALAGAAAFLARRNLVAGRGDQKGALRLAMFIFVAHMAAFVLGADHDPDFGELALVAVAAGMGLFKAALLWLAYVALEPLARRRWPHALISWSRLLAGRWRDPLVARDVLIGIAVALTISLCFLASDFAERALGRDTVALPGALDLLRGVRQTLAFFTLSLGYAPLNAIALFLLFLLVRFAVRKDWIAVALTGVLAILQNILTASNPWVVVLVVVPGVILLFGTIVRTGLTTFAVAAFTLNNVQQIPSTFDFTLWYAAQSIVLFGGVAAIALWAFRTALAGRPLLPQTD